MGVSVSWHQVVRLNGALVLVIVASSACGSQKARPSADPEPARAVREARHADAGSGGLPSALRRSAPPDQPVAICTVGVDQCDYYFRKVSACLHKTLPRKEWLTIRASLRNVCKTWKLVAREPARRDALIEECTRALHEAQKSFSNDCAW